MATDLREIPSAYDSSPEEREAVARLVQRNVPADEVDDITEMLLGQR